MKFTFADFSKEIEKQLTAKGLTLSDKTMSKAEEMLSLAGEDEELSSFVTKVAPFIVGFAGEKQNEVSKEIKDKKLVPADTIKPNNVDDSIKPKNGEDNDDKSVKGNAELVEALNAIINPLKEELTTLKSQIAENNTIKTIESNKQKLIADSLKKNYSQRIINVSMKGFDFSTDDAAERWETLLSENALEMGETPRSGNDDETQSANFNELKEKLEAEKK